MPCRRHLHGLLLPRLLPCAALAQHRLTHNSASDLSACRGVTGQGAYIKFLKPAGAAWRFLTARRRRGRFVPEGASTAAEYQPLPSSEPSSGAVAAASGPVDD